MILPVVTEPNPILHTVCTPIAEVSKEIRQLAANMRETMHNAEGVGLAAPQVGRDIALCVIEMTPDDDDPGIPYMALVNPRVTWKGGRVTSLDEGCLSIPGVQGPVRRPDRIRVKAQDLDGAEIQIEAKGFLARVLQHEIDHLNGILFTSYVPKKLLHPRQTPPYPTI